MRRGRNNGGMRRKEEELLDFGRAKVGCGSKGVTGNVQDDERNGTVRKEVKMGSDDEYKKAAGERCLRCGGRGGGKGSSREHL